MRDRGRTFTSRSVPSLCISLHHVKRDVNIRHAEKRGGREEDTHWMLNVIRMARSSRDGYFSRSSAHSPQKDETTRPLRWGPRWLISLDSELFISLVDQYRVSVVLGRGPKTSGRITIYSAMEKFRFRAVNCGSAWR